MRKECSASRSPVNLFKVVKVQKLRWYQLYRTFLQFLSRKHATLVSKNIIQHRLESQMMTTVSIGVEMDGTGVRD